MAKDTWANLSVNEWAGLTVEAWANLPLDLSTHMLAGGRKQYYLDPETELYLLGMGNNGRYYDPATARLTSEDPTRQSAGDPNLYRYVSNDPVNKLDPSGHDAAADAKKKREDEQREKQRQATENQAKTQQQQQHNTSPHRGLTPDERARQEKYLHDQVYVYQQWVERRNAARENAGRFAAQAEQAAAHAPMPLSNSSFWTWADQASRLLNPVGRAVGDVVKKIGEWEATGGEMLASDAGRRGGILGKVEEAAGAAQIFQGRATQAAGGAVDGTALGGLVHDSVRVGEHMKNVSGSWLIGGLSAGAYGGGTLTGLRQDYEAGAGRDIVSGRHLDSYERAGRAFEGLSAGASTAAAGLAGAGEAGAARGAVKSEAGITQATPAMETTSAAGKSGAETSAPKIPAAKGTEHVNLTDATGRQHILEGDAKGGGHGPGRGISGKSEFPAGWSDERVLHEASDIATSPGQKWTAPNQKNGYITTTKTVDGVNIKVVYDPQNARIVTAYPTNLPRNQ